MKKIIIAFTTAIITVSLLCITAFGANANSVPFTNILGLQYCHIYQLEYGVDYEEYPVSLPTDIGVVPTQEAIANGGVSYRSWNVVISYEGPDIKPYETVKFRLRWKMSGDSAWPFSFRKVVVRDYSKSQWDFNGQTVVGDISFGSGSGGLSVCYSDISYTNTSNKTIIGGGGPENGLTFMICFQSSKTIDFRERIHFFDTEVTNFFVGDLSGPDAPLYSGHDDLNNSVTENGQIENEIIENNQQGIEEYNASLQGLNMLLEGYADSLLAFSRFFEYIIYKFDWLYSILSFGLGLGAISFVLNLYNSFKRRS